jgi:hypothetical protein
MGWIVLAQDGNIEESYDHGNELFSSIKFEKSLSG